MDRRHFLKSSAAVSAGFFGLRAWLSPALHAASNPGTPMAAVNSLGPLIPDPMRILDLPKGFSYSIISRTGEIMDDGFPLPGMPDGMAAFDGPDGTIVLVRNHELNPDWRHLGPWNIDYSLYGKINPDCLYDNGHGKRPFIGGTTNLVYDPQSGETLRQFLSLCGTERNCAGGPTPWGTWITCEETDDLLPGALTEKAHGYNFEVPAYATPQIAKPVPLKAMGRFRHEAVAIDPATGIVYQTEDVGDGLLYRFIPDTPGKLANGGKLQALAIEGRTLADTRNWPVSKNKMPLGKPLRVKWIDMDDVESPQNDLRLRGAKKGAAVFARGEGMWTGDGEIWFACTNGGPAYKGQIFRLNPASDTLELFIQSDADGPINNADNITVSPWGDLIVCEDTATDDYLRGVTADGKVYNLGRNHYNNSELAGACFSPDGSTLFVNIQTPGLTLAIKGPWHKLGG